MSEVLPKLNSEERSSLLDALLEDQCKCWEPGQAAPKRVEAYLAEHPALQSDSDAVLVLIYNEYRLRKERGETPNEEEYIQRFPAHEHALGQQFELDRELREPLAPSTPKAGQGTVLEDFAAGADAQATASEEFPQVAGYTIQEELGKGAMGVVYKAWHNALRRHVALKMIRPGTATGREELVRFRREAQAVARLQHPYIVQIYEIGDQGGQPYLALELVEGGSLAEQLHGMPQPASQSAQLIEILARAIHYAHQRRIVHRDLKPGNVLLTSENTPKITDFGLAKRLDGIGSGRDRGSIAGTPSYMAPEQASPEKGQVGPHTDVYALGVILYEMLTGRPPFRSTEVLDTLKQVLDTLKQVCTQEPVPPRRLQPKVPRDLEAICLKCLQKEPAGRYASALALAEELHRFLDGKPVLARPMNPAERAWRCCRRNPLVASLLTGIFLVLAGGFGVSTSFWLRADYERQQAEEIGLRLDQERKQAMKLARTSFESISILTDLGHYDRAVKLANDCRAMVENLVQTYPKRLEYQIFLASTSHMLGNAHLRNGQYPAAQECYQQNCTCWERCLEEDPDNGQYRSNLGNAYQALGELQRNARQTDAALVSLDRARDILEKLVKDQSPVSGATLRLAKTYISFGLLYYDRRQWEPAVHFCSLARDQFLEQIKHDPDNHDCQSSLGTTLDYLGGVLMHKENLGHPVLGLSIVGLIGSAVGQGPFLASSALIPGRTKSLDDARTLFEQAIDQQRKAFTKAPHVPRYRRLLIMHYRNLTNTQLYSSQQAEAAKSTLERQRFLLDNPGDHYNVACDLARCIELAGKGKAHLTAAERGEREQYAAEAMKALQQAVANGYKDFERMKQDPDLALLRRREDFQKLLAVLELMSKTGAK